MDESVGNETVDTGTGTDEVTTSDEGSQTEPPVIRADSNFHDISLDVKKSGQTINEPIVIRTDDTDDVIRVHLKKDGQPYTGIKSATFYGTKQDLTIIANDPATVNNDVITYSVPKEIANIGGKIKNAYFMIDGKISTENFIITILKTVNFKGESKDYIPGLNVLIDKWNATSKEWIKKMDGLGKEVDGIDTNKILKDKIDKATDDAKADYMADFNKSVDKLNDVIADLTTKENTAVDKGKELDKAIDNVNSKINDVNNWLTTVQEEIKSANAEFIKGQQDSVEVDITALKKTISDTQELADKLSSQVDAIKNSVDSINISQINADTKTALENSKEAKDIAGGLSGKIGDVPEGSNVMAELAKAGKIDSATVNGKSVPISDKTLQITVPDPDLSEYVKTSTLGLYAKTTDVDTRLEEISNAQSVTGATVNGKDVAISNKKLQITLPDPDLSAYVKSSELSSYAKTADVDTKLNDYAKKGEIVTEGTIAAKTPLYRSTNLWVKSNNNWQNPKDMNGGSSFQLDTSFKPSDLKNGIFIGIDKHLLTDNTTYPVAYMPSLSGLIIPEDVGKFSETNFYYFMSKEEIQAALIAGNYILANEPLDGSVLRDRDDSLAGASSWSGDKGQIKLVFGNSNDGKIENLFIQLWLPPIEYSGLTINVMSFPVIDEVIAV